MEARLTPTILSSTPVNGATGVPLNGSISATFSEAMTPATLTSSTFTLTMADAGVVAGSVIYATSKAVFWPTATQLASNTLVYCNGQRLPPRAAAGVPLCCGQVLDVHHR